MRNPFRYFNSSPEVIRIAVMLYIRYPLSLRQVEDILHERGIDVSHETVRLWWNRFGPMFAAEIRKRRVRRGCYSRWRWHLDEVFVRINGEMHYLWRAVDHEGEVLEVYASKQRDRKAALRFLRRVMKRYGRPKSIVTDWLRSYGSAMRIVGIISRQVCGRWLNNRAENSHQPFRRREGPMWFGLTMPLAMFDLLIALCLVSFRPDMPAALTVVPTSRAQQSSRQRQKHAIPLVPVLLILRSFGCVAHQS